MINIFDEVKQGKFFKFEKVGDFIQGTYIDKSRGKTKFGEQIIYILKDTEGNVWNVGISVAKENFHERMKGILFGQIVGFKFDEERPTDKGNNAKIIRIYADSKFVDSEWLSTQQKLGIDPNRNFGKPTPSNEGPTGKGSTEEIAGDTDGLFNGKPFVFKAPEEASPAGGGLPKDEIKVSEIDFGAPKNDALDAIRQLATTKGLTAGMNFEDADAAIIQYTGLPLTDENFTKIIIKLTGYTKE